MIQSKFLHTGNPLFLQPGETDATEWLPRRRGTPKVRPGYVDMYPQIPCPTLRCCGWAGYLDSPICEDCSWKLHAKLEKTKGREANAAASRKAYADWELEEERKAAIRDRARAKKWQEETVRHPGWIYYLHIGDLLKIGYTSDLDQRLKQYPPNSKLLAAHPGTLKTEKQMHSKFFNSLTTGREWFKLTPDLIAHLEAARDQFKRDDLDDLPN